MNPKIWNHSVRLGFTCGYCGRPTEIIPEVEYYGREYSPGGLVAVCRACEASVGCHKGTRKPKGAVAVHDLRNLRKHAHAVFDPIWRAKMAVSGWSQKKARNAAYKWLSDQLQIPVDECHISQMRPEIVARTIEVCRPYFLKIKALKS